MSVLNRARSIVVVNSDKIALALAMSLKAKPREAQRPFFGGSPKAGWVYLFADERVADGKVLESIVSPNGDSILSVYMGHPAFESPSELTRVREALVDALAAKVGMSHESIGIDDAARGRALGLDELSTGQLIDLLHEQQSIAVMATDTHHLDRPGVGGETAPGKGRLVEASLDDAHVLTVAADGSTVVRPLND